MWQAGAHGCCDGESGSGTTGRRKPSESAREHNMMRERRRRAVSTEIFGGLRARGNYNLPNNCDNNQVLKALCNEAGWIVEPDGTTYRKGSKPVPVPVEIGGTSTPCLRNPTPSPPYSLNFPAPIPECDESDWVPLGGYADKGKSQEFVFLNAAGKAWKGKRAQDARMEVDDLELTLGLGSKNARM